MHVGHSAALDVTSASGAHPELWACLIARRFRAPISRSALPPVVDLDTTLTDQAWLQGYAVASPSSIRAAEGIKVATGYMAFNVPPPSSPNFPNLIYEPKEAGPLAQIAES